MLDKIEMNERNIKQAIADYRRHTTSTEVLDDVSDAFIKRLAADNYAAKSELRDLFRKSPAWNEELDAIVINGSRTHNPDYARIKRFADIIFESWNREADYKAKSALHVAMLLFTEPDLTDDEKQASINAIDMLAPKAYQPGKKITRVLRSLCQALGVTECDNFNYNFAQLADEITSHEIDFKLFVSINPAHFITMSNPKQDRRGSLLTSCHSFNSTNYTYNCGCSGYARDYYTFIVFTVANPDDKETLNNRKTMRQIFWYQPDSGLLLQSRLYNSAGGTNREMAESKIYRDLIQREISDLEGAPNLWKTENYVGNKKIDIYPGDDFGGYPDWIYSDFAAKISIRNDHADKYDTGHVMQFDMGAPGLCIKCGAEIAEGLYCDDCGGGRVCDCCGEHYHESELHSAYDRYGNEVLVCESCLESYYTPCDYCGEYYENDDLTFVGGEIPICSHCLERHYSQCDCCGEYYRNDDMQSAIDADGNEIYICDNCAEYHFIPCYHCGGLIHKDIAILAHNELGHEIDICPDCADLYYLACEHCGELVPNSTIEAVHDEHGKKFNVCANCAENYIRCSDCFRFTPCDLLPDGRCPNCANYEEAVA